jgi:hypothetical protein
MGHMRPGNFVIQIHPQIRNLNFIFTPIPYGSFVLVKPHIFSRLCKCVSV